MLIQKICVSCIGCNNNCNNTINQIQNKIAYIKELSNKIKAGEITINDSQSNAINDLINNITLSCNKINLEKAELNNEISNIKTLKTNYETNSDSLNSKYVRLLSCIDKRNCNLQSILNSLLQIENCINNNCVNYPYFLVLTQVLTMEKLIM